MFQKAILFNDNDIAREILEAPGTTSTDMAYIKSLGRKVKGFDDATWVANRERIVLEGNLLKFRQIEELKKKLLATGDKVIVEARTSHSWKFAIPPFRRTAGRSYYQNRQSKRQRRVAHKLLIFCAFCLSGDIFYSKFVKKNTENGGTCITVHALLMQTASMQETMGASGS